MLKILAKKILGYTVHAIKGDIVEVKYTPFNSEEEEVVLRKEIEKDVEIDTLIVFELENELGLEVGIGGAFGKGISDRENKLV